MNGERCRSQALQRATKHRGRSSGSAGRADKGFFGQPLTRRQPPAEASKTIEEGRNEEQRFHADNEGGVLRETACHRADNIGAESARLPGEPAEHLGKDNAGKKDWNRVRYA